MCKERPILFSAPMVRALLDGSKTQTRRVAKFKEREPGINPSFSGLRLAHYATGHPECGFVLRSGSNDRTFPLRSPYGQPGDLLWVRETWRGVVKISPPGAAAEYGVAHYVPDQVHCRRVEYAATQERGGEPWRPSIHMPRWASRILLEIVSVRVERLNDCSEADALAEGVKRCPAGDHFIDAAAARHVSPVGDPAVEAYRSLWDSINGASAWAANPWVWVIEFKPVTS